MENELKGTQWYQDSNGKSSAKRVLGALLVIQVMVMMWMKLFDLHCIDSRIDWTTVIGLLATGLSALAIGGLTKGG